ncbi:MAG: chitinase, partial [Chloroflexi bacterium]
MAGLRTRALLVGASLAVVVGFGGSTVSTVSAATALPARVYAPYFETWTTDGITATAQASGVRYFTLAFLQSLSKTSCTVEWNGSA